MRGVLSPSGTRLAPTEAVCRPVACCFERPEQLRKSYDLILSMMPGFQVEKASHAYMRSLLKLGIRQI